MENQDAFITNTLNRLKIDALNEMQLATIAAAEQHNDLILLSNTGSGKTLAYLIPIVQQLSAACSTTQALIIAPSRELAMQIEQVFKKMGTGYKITCCYGGHLRETEENNLLQPPAVIVGTPGRLADHIRRNNITTHSIETLVLDEFDKSLELGFQEEMTFIINALPALKKRLLISATEMVKIPDFVGLQQPETIRFLSEINNPEKLVIQSLFSPNKDKLDSLFQLICYLGNRSAIVFCNHRDAVERTSSLLAEKGIHNVYYHGAMEQQERDSALCKFRNGSTNVLVTTDLAARGVDIPNIRYIIHYHLPHTEDAFTHRNGRTARMNASGTVILILSDEEKMPGFVTEEVTPITLPDAILLPEKPKWVTIFIAAGKKDKVNKVDIVGFFSKTGKLKQEDIGLIEVKDFFSFVAIKKIHAANTLHLVKNEKIKNKKVKIEIAK